MGKELETAVVTKAGMQGGGHGCAHVCYGLSSHSSSCCRGREDGVCQAALAQLETSRSMP